MGPCASCSADAERNPAVLRQGHRRRETGAADAQVVEPPLDGKLRRLRQLGEIRELLARQPAQLDDFPAMDSRIPALLKRVPSEREPQPAPGGGRRSR